MKGKTPSAVFFIVQCTQYSAVCVLSQLAVPFESLKGLKYSSFMTWRYRMNPCWKCSLYLLLCVLTWQAYGQQSTGTGSINVDSSGSTVSTRVGCYQELQCTGVGTRIAWRLFGVREDLTNTSDYYVLMESEPVEGGQNPRVMKWRSRLVFPSIPLSSGAGYSCSVFNDEVTSTPPQIVTVQLRVLPEVMSITPPIQDKNLSSYYVGDPLLMGCPVHTCARGVTVQFFFNDSIVATGMPSNTDIHVYTTSIPVTLESAGTYTCVVTADTPDGMATQSFNVTGTPMLRPVTVPSSQPSTVSKGISNTGPTPTQEVDSTPMTTTGHGVQLSPSLSLSLLLALGAWLCMHRLW